MSIGDQSVWKYDPTHIDPRTGARWTSNSLATGPPRHTDQTSTRTNPTTYHNFPSPSVLGAFHHLYPSSCVPHLPWWTQAPSKLHRHRPPLTAIRSHRTSSGSSTPACATPSVLRPTNFQNRHAAETLRMILTPHTAEYTELVQTTANAFSFTTSARPGRKPSDGSSSWGGAGLRLRNARGKRPRSDLRNHALRAPQDVRVAAAEATADWTPRVTKAHIFQSARFCVPTKMALIADSGSSSTQACATISRSGCNRNLAGWPTPPFPKRTQPLERGATGGRCAT